MDTDKPVIDITNLHRRYGKLDAVNGLSLRVRPGRCYGFFGRNGAGKTTTIKCLLNLLRPTAGTVRVFGLDPQKDEVAVKSRLAYVPDMVAFYPWMTVRDTLNYQASFRQHWNETIAVDLQRRFELDPASKRPPTYPRAKKRNSPSSAPSRLSRKCWCWTSRRPAWTPLCVANSLRR
jgi:ABC-2 type transport system ATP-binding protein